MTDVQHVLPEILVSVLALLVLVIDSALPRRAPRGWLAGLVAVGLIGALASGPLVTERIDAFGGFVRVDSFTTFTRAAFILLALLSVLVAPGYLERRRIPQGEYYAIILFSTVGAMTIALSNDLITLFLGIELMSIPVYVLAGMQRHDRYSNEAALKYFLLGAFSSSLLLYGFAWLYGVTGSTEFEPIAAALAVTGIADGATVIALGLITAGLGFKAAVVPFHQWTPDAYDGAPTPATAFMSVAPKAAAFVAVMRLMFGALAPLEVDWSLAFAALAAITMTVGNVVALVQTNVKRMLAYSSIAHTGYILAAVAAYRAGDSAGAAVLFYVVAYGVMNLGAFACLILTDVEGTRGATLSELNGFAGRAPFGALVFAIFLISLTGIPPTVGFLAKVFVIQPVIDAGLVWLAVVIALNAVLAAFYYLRVLVHMYMHDTDERSAPVVPGWLLNVSLGVSALAVVVFGILPDSLYAWALEAAAPLTQR